MLLLGGAESMPKITIGRVTWLSPLPRGRRTTPNYSLKARMLRIKQVNGLDFSTAFPTSPRRLPILPLSPFFMKFLGPQALPNRSHTTMSCPTGSSFLDITVVAIPKTVKRPTGCVSNSAMSRFKLS